MQNIWLSKIDWGDNLTPELSNQWHDRGNFSKVEIDGFCAAILKAYGCSIYMRSIYCDNSVTSNLIVAKSRVAPVKTISLPKLELCGAVLLSRLASTILSAVENKIYISSVCLWTESQIVLCWLGL